MRPAVRSLCIGLLVAAVLGLFIGLGLLRGESHPQARSAHAGALFARPPADSGLPREISRAKSRFALLRGEAEGLPAPVERILHAPTKGMRWSDAQRLPIRTPARLWAVPGNNFLCFVAQQDSQSVGTICSTLHRALRHGLYACFLSSPATNAVTLSRVIIGVAPDGTREVVVYTDGTPVRIPVVHGIFKRRDEEMHAPAKVTLVPSET